jgi:hypothetical protein
MKFNLLLSKSLWAFSIPVIFLLAPVVASAQKQPIDCSQLRTRTEVFEGRSYSKFVVVDSGYMRCPQVQAQRPSMPWTVRKTEWSTADEQAFGEFVKKLGYSRCGTTDECLSGPDNLLRSEQDLLFTHYSDCADFPYYLRSYFAYKSGLPFSMIAEIKQVPFTPEQLAFIEAERARLLETKGEAAVLAYDARLRDQRYSRNGNIPVRKLNVPASNGAVRDFGIFGPRIMDQISSGTLRMLNGDGAPVESDFYSPVVQKGSIRPGTVLYSANGHVAIVYDVTPKGDVLFIDAHPDNSITRGVFQSTKENFQVVNKKYGGNFKNFRNVRVLDPQFGGNGEIVSGKVVADNDGSVSDVSLEQYEGQAKSATGGPLFKLDPNSQRTVNFNDWVRFRLSGGTYRLNPLVEMRSEMNQLCAMANDRVAAVQAAVNDGIHKKDHPETLPQNIFGASGEWEAYSTPGRDLRLKMKMYSIPNAAKDWVARYQAQDPLVEYSGADLKGDLILTYKESVAQCVIKYRNSLNQSIKLELESIIGRVARLSYDPYACPEIRWGAAIGSAEANTCQDSQEKLEWHALQQYLRNNTEKDTEAVHGHSLDELRSKNERKEVDNSDHSKRFSILKRLQAL